jgi:hypothetical protein
MLLTIAVELVEKFTANRHAEPDERLFHDPKSPGGIL